MNLEIWLAYITTVLILMSTPGPSQLLMLSNSLGNGFKRSLSTACGDLSANAIQMTVASFGLVAAVHASREFFVFIKWAGVVYLLYLGLVKMLGRGPQEEIRNNKPRSLRSLYWQGFATSAANPKAVVFFAALFPQFVDTSKPTGIQFLILGVTYLVFDGFFLCCYGRFADWIRRKFQGTAAYSNKISGSLLILAALLLGLKNVETN